MKSFLRKIPVQAFLFAFFTILIFWVLGAPVREVQDIVTQGEFAYLANGEQGVLVLNISDPNDPKEIDRFDTLGTANGLALRGKDLFVADGDNGIVVLDASDPNQLVYKWGSDAFPKASDVAIWGDHAFIADASKGWQS